MKTKLLVLVKVTVKDQILISWIGHADLIAMSNELPAKQKKLVEVVTGTSRKIEGTGPVKALLAKEKFKEVHLLNSNSTAIGKLFAKWAGGKSKVHDVEITNPTDHSQILGVVRPLLNELKLTAKQELCFHLSPGTPAMAAIWILLAKSKYPATLFQTFRGDVSKAIVPFDVTVEVVPQLFSEPDRFWQHLVEDGLDETPGFSSIVGNSAPLKMAMGRAKRAAIFDVTVLILGESGTGKELFGRAIHEASQRRSGPFVTINCAAISKELLESELFGHMKGSYTGADKDRAGAFEVADGGTLFLDEVGECDLAMQAKILRALQPPPGESPSKRVFRRVGATNDTVTDVRVVAATNRNLAGEIGNGNFREDLFYRLAMITVKLPPLRQRKGDIRMLAKSLLEQINEQFTSTERPGYKAKSLPTETLKYLENYHWPGNVRELYNALIQSAIMQDAEKLKPRDIASSLATMPSQLNRSSTGEVVLGDGFDVDEYLDEIHAELIRKAMSQSGNIKKRAAELLGVKNYQTLAARLERLGVNQN